MLTLFSGIYLTYEELKHVLQRVVCGLLAVDLSYL